MPRLGTQYPMINLIKGILRFLSLRNRAFLKEGGEGNGLEITLVTNNFNLQKGFTLLLYMFLLISLTNMLELSYQSQTFILNL